MFGVMITMLISYTWLSHIMVEGAKNSLNLLGTMLGYYPGRVLPSKTAIAPVNPTFLPMVASLLRVAQFFV